MGFGICMLICGTFFIAWGISYNVKEKNKEKEKKNQIEKDGKKYDAVFSTELKHICGLPLADNSSCILYLCKDNIVIESKGNIFKLSNDNIMDMSIKTSREVQNSISGAVGGYALLGPIGAFLGGSSTTFHRFFIIIYRNKEKQDQCISFDIKEDSRAYKEINNYINSYQNNIIKKKEIEL